MPSESLTDNAISLGADAVYQFDESTGSLLDFVASNDGTVTGSVTRPVTDQRGEPSAYDFGGSGQYIELASTILGGASAAYTIEAIFRIDASAGAFNHLIDHRDAAADGVRLAAVETVGGGEWRMELNHNSSAPTLQSPKILSPGVWYHVHATWDGTNVRIYIDAVLDATAPASTTINTSTRPVIGGRSFSFADTNNWSGEIAHLGVWNDAALTLSQIQQQVALATGGSTTLGITPATYALTHNLTYPLTYGV